MRKEKVFETGDIVIESIPGVKCVITPRIALVSGGKVALLRYKDTNWHYLTGGKVKHSEAESVNLLSPAESFHILAREVREEVDGLDIQPLKDSARFIGLSEVNAVYESSKTIINHTSPIFMAIIDDHQVGIRSSLENNPNIHMLPVLESPGEIPVFPDARFAFNTLLRHRGEPGGFLYDGLYFFQMEPEIGLLFSPPDWFKP